ncbi:MAG: phosphate acetyltransferase [Actinomycetaceae bacterium]|nr:phosphate acetyltransferase [Arcanobacterium sp.]MDD7504684.1 phosphate acetyltransferase [Actinomycetaceae bacterium]MDY6143955.1 phosphate acetyltransferase [Arcanobacterium sp.]
MAMVEVIKGIDKLQPNLGLFRAFTNDDIHEDYAFQQLLALIGREDDLERAWGTTRREYAKDADGAVKTMETRYNAFAKDFDAVVVIGLLESDPFFPGELDRSVHTTANLGTTVVPIFSGAGRTTQDVVTIARLFRDEFTRNYAPVSAMIIVDGPRDIRTHVPEDEEHTAIISIYTDTHRFNEAEMDVIDHAFNYDSKVVTPLGFTASLIDRASKDRKRIVLPESDDDRILRATDELLARNVADIVLLGDPESVEQRAAKLGVDISGADIVQPTDPDTLEKYAQEYARLREKKGVTIEQARETVKDISFFGTLMVHMGDADGMVSGAAHTTAHTIVPSFQVIKTKPGTATVSSSFIMLMADRVYVYGDCAVTTNPSPEELASIAISSAETARAFGVEPRIAMLSYSTGTSGKGPSVDAVAEATRIAREMCPDLPIEGPIQYDAAVDPSVAASKMPDSDVAGKATVFIFPDLNAGNIAYKAVQRSSGAVAVGPVLQGLNKPVNDLSRGALVEDIVNTVAITAIQAQENEAERGEAGESK